MGPDDEICLCFHVTRRKIESFIRVNRLRRPGQLSECFGAGTGCGWCRPFLVRLFQEAVRQGTVPSEDMTPERYAELRERYLESGERPGDAESSDG